MGCYHYEFYNKTGKGCVSQLTKQEEDACKESKYCKICFGPNCNNRILFKKCFICDSLTDPNCKTLVGNNLYETETCDSYESQCFVFINGTYLQRGCLNDMSKEFIMNCNKTLELQCEYCQGDGCNKKIPSDTCLNCDGGDCGSNPNKYNQTFCSLKKEPSGCYRKELNGIVSRGCLFDMPSFEWLKCGDKSEICQPCFDVDCNKKISFQQNCYSCNGTESNNCQSNKDYEQIKCQNYLSSCIAGIDSEGKMHRGCSTGSRTKDSLQYPKGYKLCFDELCNKD